MTGDLMCENCERASDDYLKAIKSIHLEDWAQQPAWKIYKEALKNCREKVK